jgi:plastocyanin domain-containing protein
MTLWKRLSWATSLLLLVAGCKSKTEGGSAPPPAPLKPGAIAVTADDKGFTPSSVTFKKGAPASLVFTRTTDETCATEVVFPELKVKKDLPKGTPVTIDIPTDKEQKLTFQCGMGMYKSSVVINPGS